MAETPLLKAIKHGHAPIVSILLQAGADVNAANKMGETPLSFAAARPCNREVFCCLISVEGICLDAVDSNGDTALIMAAKAGLLENVQALVAAGVNLRIQNKRGQTALSLAKSCRHTEVAQWLEEHLPNP